MPTATLPEVEFRPRRTGGGGSEIIGGGGDDFQRRGRPHVPANSYRLGLWFGLGAILMLFVAFTSAYIYRQGLSFDWQPLSPLPILWFNTGVLVLSSATFELGRRALKQDLTGSFLRWLTVTTIFGITFLTGQYLAWRQLAARGIFLGTNPHSSFFYVLTGTHALHLLGGVLGLGYVMMGAWRQKYTSRECAAVDVTAVYWHFMDGLWIYLFLLLFLWR
ncbi:MAG: cytochrome c oxidase subunit 3 [Acidobacteriia bacterium]|nr:cytochrome c oxidase subunit 3 [Terriglobia bacterium]